MNITQSGTRKEEKLVEAKTLEACNKVRRLLINMPPQQAMKSIIEAMQKHPTNEALLASLR
jgi:transcription termination factor Rho